MMAPPRPSSAGRFGRPALDPSRPLYVCRRISRGAAGALPIGQVFDASSVAPARLRNLYLAGYIAHELPKTVGQAVAAALARGRQQAAALEQPEAAGEPPKAPPVAEPPKAKPAAKASATVTTPSALVAPKPGARRPGA